MCVSCVTILWHDNLNLETQNLCKYVKADVIMSINNSSTGSKSVEIGKSLGSQSYQFYQNGKTQTQ